MASQTADAVKLFLEIEYKLKHSMRRCFEDKGITMPQGIVIGSLYKHGEMKISELSAKLGLSNSTVSGIIDRLEKQNIVVRTRSQKDKRIVYVKLTPQFSDVHQSALKIGEDKFAEMLAKGSDEEIAKAIDGLNTLKNILERTQK